MNVLMRNLIQCIGDMALLVMPKRCERIANFLGLKKNNFWDLWSPDMTPYPTPDALWMIVLSLGHSIMYVTMRNLNRCMGDMALMPKICEK